MALGAHERVEREIERAAERLAAVFVALPAVLVRQVVRRAEHDLHGQVGADALGELLERLAAYRLAELVEATGPWTVVAAESGAALTDP